MNKKILGPWVVASLLFAPVVWADDGLSFGSLLEIFGIDAGSAMDPNGDEYGRGALIDPDGQSSADDGRGIDPNGLNAGDKGMGLDPNG